MNQDVRTIYSNLNSIDVLKLVMAIVVIAIHTDPTYNQDGGVKEAYSLICSFAVPTFFLVSGYLLSMKCEFSDSHEHVFIKQLKNVGIMYLKWMLIYTPLLIVHIILINEKCSISLIMNEGIKYIRNLLLVGSQYNSYQLWYLLSLLYVLIFLLCTTKVSRNRKYSSRLLVIVIAVAFIMMNIVDAIQNSSSTSMMFLQKIISMTVQDSRLLTGFVYIPLGMLIFRYYHNRNSSDISFVVVNFILFIIGVVIRIFITEGLALRLVSTVALFCVILGMKMGKDDSRVFINMRKISTHIYLIHMYVWTFYYMIVYGQKTYGIDCFLVTSIVSIVISLIFIIYQKQKIKWGVNGSKFELQ